MVQIQQCQTDVRLAAANVALVLQHRKQTFLIEKLLESKTEAGIFPLPAKKREKKREKAQRQKPDQRRGMRAVNRCVCFASNAAFGHLAVQMRADCSEDDADSLIQKMQGVRARP